MSLDRRTFLKVAGASVVLPALGGTACARTPDVVSLERYQSAYRNQADRDSCFAFATCAAIEAAYKRKYGIELHLSEQYAIHINKTFELYTDYATNQSAPHENNSSYWGFQGGTDLVGKLAICALPDAAAAPYLTETQMTALKKATPACGELNDRATQEQIDAFEFLQEHIPTAARHAARCRVLEAAAGRYVHKSDRKRARRWSRGGRWTAVEGWQRLGWSCRAAHRL